LRADVKIASLAGLALTRARFSTMNIRNEAHFGERIGNSFAPERIGNSFAPVPRNARGLRRVSGR